MARHRDHEVMDYRLSEWKRLARQGILVADIAARLGMSRAALDQMLCRARRRGHPDAVYHADARFKSPTPTRRQVLERDRKRRRRLRARLARQAVQDSARTDTKE